MPYEKQLLTEVPRVAPDVVVEVLSPGDRIADINEKIRVYLKAGTQVVVLVDPGKRVVVVHELSGQRTLENKDVLRHSALPGFVLDVSQLFTLPKPK